ncbi:MAG: fimbrillin family protein [Bacteroidaceae bacterium]|nr:fimbrillin family protein [Bacteroidaceae bacterium]
MRRLADMIVPICAIAILLTESWGCTEDISVDSANNKKIISFSAKVSQDWTGVKELAKARARGESRINTPYSIELKGYCEDELFLNVETTNGIDKLNDLDKHNTRAILQTSISNSFGVFVSAYSGNWNSATCAPNYIYNKEASTSNNSTWGTTQKYYWPGEGSNIRVWAYYPYDSSGINGFTAQNVAGVPGLSYTVPTDYSSQEDLMVADTRDPDNPTEINGSPANATIGLPFKHAFAAIRFKIGSEGMRDCVITKITIQSVYDIGTLYMDNSWDPSSLAKTRNLNEFAIPLSFSTAGRTNEFITSDDQTLMMIPQQIPAGAKIILDYNIDGVAQRALEGNIAGTIWEAGKTYVYSINPLSVNHDYILSVSRPNILAMNGGSETMRITSYRQSYTGANQTGISWEMTYTYTQNGTTYTNTTTPPSWLTVSKRTGSGGTSAESVTVTASKVTEMVSTESHDEVLRRSAHVGTNDEPYDLSMYDLKGNRRSAMTTANCYVVNAPGVYMLPLVYGNAIKNGIANINAYHTSVTTAVSGSAILQNFKDHKGNGIYGSGSGTSNAASTSLSVNKDPYIWSHYTPNSPIMVWQDTPSLITNLRLSSDKHYLIFDINETNVVNGSTIQTIRQGNAVIGVLDSEGYIMWSWHIWVTDEDMSKTVLVTNHTGKPFFFMAGTVGWVSANSGATTYANREVTVNVRQTNGTKQASVKIVQNGGSEDTGGNREGRNTYYQWGRKDPMKPSLGTSGNTEITAYDYSTYAKGEGGNTDFRNSSGTNTGSIALSIQNPHILYRSGAIWYALDPRYENLWSANNNVVGTTGDALNTVVKTIYDPSPAGYKVPEGDAFTGFTITGSVSTNTSEFHVWGSFNKGWYFYSDNGGGDTFFFPASGLRRFNGDLSYCGTEGHYWNAIPSTDTNGCGNLVFTSAYMNPINGSTNNNKDGWYRGHAESIRPVSDE